jgi:hypothetical protein
MRSFQRQQLRDLNQSHLTRSFPVVPQRPAFGWDWRSLCSYGERALYSADSSILEVISPSTTYIHQINAPGEHLLPILQLLSRQTISTDNVLVLAKTFQVFHSLNINHHLLPALRLHCENECPLPASITVDRYLGICKLIHRGKIPSMACEVVQRLQAEQSWRYALSRNKWTVQQVQLAGGVFQWTKFVLDQDIGNTLIFWKGDVMCMGINDDEPRMWWF